MRAAGHGNGWGGCEGQRVGSVGQRTFSPMHTATNGGKLREKESSLGAPASLNLRGTRESIPLSLNLEYDSHCAASSASGLEILTRVPDARPRRLSLSQSPHVTAAPCLPLRSWSCITPCGLLKMITLPLVVPIAS